MEYLVKNGAPRCIQELKDDMFKVRALQDFSFSENGVDRGQGGKYKDQREIYSLFVHYKNKYMMGI